MVLEIGGSMFKKFDRVKLSSGDFWIEDTRNIFTRKSKDEYEGKVGMVIHVVLPQYSDYDLYDVMFDDGAIWCYERSELKKV